MTFEEDVRKIEEYERWKGEKKVNAADYSPARFVVEQAQGAAYDKLIAIKDELDGAEAINADPNEEPVTLEDVILNIRQIMAGL